MIMPILGATAEARGLQMSTKMGSYESNVIDAPDGFIPNALTIRIPTLRKSFFGMYE